MMNEGRFVHYKTGDEQMDKEHWDLLIMMDKVCACIRQSPHCNAEDKIKNMLKAFTVHIQRESIEMDNYGYPYAAHHKALHSSILDVVNEVSNTIKNGHLVSEHSIRNLENLFVKHIDEQDIQMMTYVIANRGNNGKQNQNT